MISTVKEVESVKVMLTPFLKVFEQYVEYMDAKTYPHLQVLAVLLQNLVFDASNCVGYNHFTERDKMNKIVNLMRTISEYHNDYTCDYLLNEVNTAIMFASHSEDN